jgi:tRNA threonylcarbamoyladenosine biosynthesis protein TsaE
MLVEKLTENEYCIDIDSIEECQQLAVAIAKQPLVPGCIALVGTLGAGKTQFTRFFATEIGANPEEVSSPTFVLLHQYDTTPPLCHVDAYRIGDEDEFLEIGIEEVLEDDCITIIEWADRFPDLLPRDHLMLQFSQVDSRPHQRRIHAVSTGPRSLAWITSSLDRLPSRMKRDETHDIT